MRPSERLARAFYDGLRVMGPRLDPDLMLSPWDELALRKKAVYIAVAAYLLDQNHVELSPRLRRTDFPSPAEVRDDVREVQKAASGLTGLYARAHEELAGIASGGSDGGGRSSLHDVDPTAGEVFDGLREVNGRIVVARGSSAARRRAVRRAAERIGEAREHLEGARHILGVFAPSRGYRQPHETKGPSLVSKAELAESIAAQERRLSEGG